VTSHLATITLPALSGPASARNSGTPELCQLYPSTPDCSCNIDPCNVVCGLSGWGNVPDLHDGVTPPDPGYAYHHVTRTSTNPYYATCSSSAADRYACATREICMAITAATETRSPTQGKAPSSSTR
jgi:hypothetical protein